MVTSLFPEIATNLRIFKAPMGLGQRHAGVEKAPSMIVDGFDFWSTFVPRGSFKEVTVHECPEPELNLTNDILTFAHEEGDMVLTVGGDHLVAFYSTAAQLYKHGPENLGVIWVDAHTDINTEESSVTGNKHGMVVSGLMGLESFWGTAIAAGYELRPENIVYVGARDMDPYEKEFIQKHDIRVYSSDDIRRHGARAVMGKVLYDDLAHVQNIHCSFDVDVIDPTIFPATGTPVPGGITTIDAMYIMMSIGDDVRFSSMDLVEFNPMLATKDFNAKDCCVTCYDLIVAGFI